MRYYSLERKTQANVQRGPNSTLAELISLRARRRGPAGLGGSEVGSNREPEQPLKCFVAYGLYFCCWGFIYS